MRKYGITFQAYSPLGHGTAAVHPVVEEIAVGRNVSGSQVALAWIVRQGHTFVTSSSSVDYDREDLAAPNLKLTDDEMRRLNTIRAL